MKEKKPFSDLSKIIFEDFDEAPWPCFVRPCKDELLTSWLTRVARNHLLRYYSFCSSHFSESEFWNRDLDRLLPKSSKGLITKRSIITGEELDKMLLTSYEGSISLTTSKANSFWLTPLNFYRNSRKHPSRLMVCPSCFKKDGETPYYRKAWRLTVSVVCEKCETELIDCCPNCNAEINYLQSERGKKMQTPLFPISCCWRCLYDLRRAKVKKASPDTTKMQLKIFETINNGFDEVHQLNYSHLYFDVLKKIITILNNSNRSLKSLHDTIGRLSDLKDQVPSNNKLHPFQTLDVSTRRNILQKAFWLLENWPQRFNQVTKEAKLHSKLFLADFKDCPYWFYKEINANNRLVFAKWRSDYPEYSYSSFTELATFRASKIKTKKT